MNEKQKKTYIEKIKTKVPKDTLINLYCKQSCSIAEIIKTLDISQAALKHLLEEYQITRPKNAAKSKANTISKNKHFLDVKGRITRGDLYKYYIEEDHEYYETQKHFDITDWTFNRLLDEYNIVKDRSKSFAKGYQKRVERYGSDNIMNTKKAKETKIKKYGSLEAAYQHTSAKIREIWKNKTEDELARIREQTRNTCIQKYGVTAPCQLPQARAKGNNSKPNQHFAELLTLNSIPFEREKTIENNSFDFIIDNTLIEINPTSTHNSTWGIYDNAPLDKKYHLSKTALAKKYNFRCIHVWDWDNYDKIIAALNPNKHKYYARNLILVQITDKKFIDNFMNMYHFQNTCSGQMVCYGLLSGEDMIQIMTFGKPRYNKNYEWELLRLCTKSDCIVVGGAEKLYKHFLDIYNPTSLISYCDNNKFSGDIYIKLGMKLLSQGNPSKHWYNMKTKQHITDNLLRQRGFDQLFHTDYGKGTSNEQLMLDNKFVCIYDAGQSTYVWNNDLKLK